MNAVHSSLRDFCRQLAKHNFFATKVRFSDKRYAYFDVVSKMAAIEIDGLETGFRFDEIKSIFENQANFFQKSAAGKRITDTLDYLDRAFPAKSPELRNRSLVQSFATLAAQIVKSRGGPGFRDRMAAWLRWILGAVTPPISPRLPA